MPEIKRYHEIPRCVLECDPLSLIGRDDANLWQKLRLETLRTPKHQPTHQPINPSTHQPINPSTHQPINPSTHQPINPSTHQPINAPPDTASHQTSRSKSPTSRCLLPLRIATAAQIHMIATIENLPPFGSSRRYQMQKSLLHQWSSRRTLACLDLKITHSPDTQRVIEKENTTSW